MAEQASGTSNVMTDPLTVSSINPTTGFRGKPSSYSGVSPFANITPYSYVPPILDIPAAATSIPQQIPREEDPTSYGSLQGETGGKPTYGYSFSEYDDFSETYAPSTSLVTQTGGSTNYNTGQGSESNPLASTIRKDAANALGYDVVGQTSPAEVAGTAIGMVTGIPGIGPLASKVSDSLSSDTPQRGDFGTQDARTGAVYGPDGRAYDPITGSAMSVYSGIGPAVNAVTSGYGNLRGAGYDPVQSALGSYENSTANISKASRDMGVSPGSVAGLKTISGNQSLIDAMSGYTPITRDFGSYTYDPLEPSNPPLAMPSITQEATLATIAKNKPSNNAIKEAKERTKSSQKKIDKAEQKDIKEKSKIKDFEEAF